jgi:hypothetical protein
MNFKSFGIWDMTMTKLSVLSATLFLVSAWNGFANWVMSVHWAWFLIIGLVSAIKPLITVFKK